MKEGAGRAGISRRFEGLLHSFETRSSVVKERHIPLPPIDSYFQIIFFEKDVN